MLKCIVKNSNLDKAAVIYILFKTVYDFYAERSLEF